jgi:hypothetical protein
LGTIAPVLGIVKHLSVQQQRLVDDVIVLLPATLQNIMRGGVDGNRFDNAPFVGKRYPEFALAISGCHY